MLKPKRKIIRKEIKRDPFIETIDKLEKSYDKNKKTFLNIILVIITGVFVINFLLKKQDQKNIDSNSALGIAMVAFENRDYENAKFQLETITSDFSGTAASDVANFYLGKIYFESEDFVKSELYLKTFLNTGDSKILYFGAIKVLANIALQNNEYDKAIKLLDSGLKKVSTSNSIELKILKTHVLKNKGNTNLAKEILEEVMLEKKLPRHLRQRSEELIGMM